MSSPAATSVDAERAAVLAADELPPGARATVSAFGSVIALFNVGGRLYALDNRCPHHGGPLCHGVIGGAPVCSAPHEYVWGMEDEVLTCPWHGWEFELATGRTLFDPSVGVATYRAEVEDGQIVLSLA